MLVKNILKNSSTTKIKEEKDKKEKLVIKEISKRFESDWRKELEEGMTTTNVFSTTLPAEGDQAIDQVNPIDAASFADADNMFTSGEFGNTNTQNKNATTIRSSGSVETMVDLMLVVIILRFRIWFWWFKMGNT